jgi:DNA-directed RNA polymerase specialized sigma24 family protein
VADVQQELWNAFRSQPSEATFRPLYESTRALVYTLCQRILRHEEDAQDAFQAVYCRLLELARDGEKARAAAPVENIVYRLAVREADNLRKRRRRRSLKEVAMGAAYLPGAQLTPERIAAVSRCRTGLRVFGIFFTRCR